MSYNKHYINNKQYGKRYLSDSQFINTSNCIAYSGIIDRQARFVEENALMNASDWKLFVEQFRRGADDVDSGWRGEYFGKMMRGACMTYQYTKNEELYCLLTSTVEDMLTTQDEYGRFSSYLKIREFTGWDIWSRKYVILGFLHYHEICRDEALRSKIVSALTSHLDYIASHIGDGKTDIGKTSQIWLGINSASILEPVIRMYNLVGREEYLSLAQHIIKFLSDGEPNIITLALENKLMPHQYPVKKAYEMMSCFEGVLEYYRLTGEEKWKTAAINFANAVYKNEITVIGCAGCDEECFDNAVATETSRTGIMQETCVTVTWMKLCNQLLLLTSDPKYADMIERSFYNALYGAINNELTQNNGGFIFDSYSPLTLGKRGILTGGYKNISAERYYGCCAAIGAAGSALPALTAVTATSDGIAVNYYESGCVKINGLDLMVETAYPAGDTVKITVKNSENTKKLIALRIPAFSGKNTSISVNGETITVENEKSDSFYAEIERKWNAEDTIEICFDMNARIIRPVGIDGKEETKDFFSLLYGPLVLALDSRLTSVGETIPLDGKISVNAHEKVLPKCLFSADVIIGNKKLLMIDYGSAGKTWDEHSQIEAWIKCK